MISDVINELNQRAENNRLIAHYLRGLKQKEFKEAREARANVLEKEAAELFFCATTLKGLL